VNECFYLVSFKF